MFETDVKVDLVDRRICVVQVVEKTGPDGKLLPEMILVTNTLRNDLNHPNECVNCGEPSRVLKGMLNASDGCSPPARHAWMQVHPWMHTTLPVQAQGERNSGTIDSNGEKQFGAN